MIRKLKDAPQKVKDAMSNVQIFFPEVCQVTFNQDQFWSYTDALGNAPDFDETGIDVGLLEDALDSIEKLPITYTE